MSACSVTNAIEKKIQSLDPQNFTLVDESDLHHFPKRPSHLNLLVVSRAFETLPLLARHRKLNALLKEEIQQLHSLRLSAYTPEEWAKQKTPIASPPCQKKRVS